MTSINNKSKDAGSHGVPPVPGATWVEDYDRSTGHVSGYWKMPDGRRVDTIEISDGESRILVLNKKSGKKSSSPSAASVIAALSTSKSADHSAHELQQPEGFNSDRDIDKNGMVILPKGDYHVDDIDYNEPNLISNALFLSSYSSENSYDSEDALYSHYGPWEGIDTSHEIEVSTADGTENVQPLKHLHDYIGDTNSSLISHERYGLDEYNAILESQGRHKEAKELNDSVISEINPGEGDTEVAVDQNAYEIPTKDGSILINQTVLVSTDSNDDGELKPSEYAWGHTRVAIPDQVAKGLNAAFLKDQEEWRSRPEVEREVEGENSSFWYNGGDIHDYFNPPVTSSDDVIHSNGTTRLI